MRIEPVPPKRSISFPVRDTEPEGKLDEPEDVFIFPYVSILPTVTLFPEMTTFCCSALMVSPGFIEKEPILLRSASAVNTIVLLVPGAKVRKLSAKSLIVISLVASRVTFVPDGNPSNAASEIVNVELGLSPDRI